MIAAIMKAYIEAGVRAPLLQEVLAGQPIQTQTLKRWPEPICIPPTSADEIVLLAVEPESLPSFIEAIHPSQLALVLGAPAGSPREFRELQAALSAAGREIMMVNHYAYRAGALRLLAAKDARNLGGITELTASFPLPFRDDLRYCIEDKALFDLTLSCISDALWLIERLGASIVLETAQVEYTIGADYWEQMTLTFPQAGGGVARVKFFPDRRSEQVGSIEAHYQGAAATWVFQTSEESIALELGGAKRQLKLPVASVGVGFWGAVEAHLGGAPAFAAYASYENAFPVAVELFDRYLFHSSGALQRLRRESLRSNLITNDAFWGQFIPYSYQNYDLAFRASLEHSKYYTQPVNKPFSLLLVRLPIPLQSNFLPAPLGIAQLAAITRSAGISTDLLDLATELRPQRGVPLTAEELDHLAMVMEEHCAEKRYDMIGFSLDELELWPTVVTLSSRVARRYTDVVAIGGRPAGDISRDAVAATRAVDYIVEGEGEIAIMQLIRFLQGEERLEHVPGLWSADWPVRKSPTPPLFPDFMLHPPPDFSGLDLMRYPSSKPSLQQPYLPYLFILGCPYKCVFCANESNQLPRFRPMKQVVSDLRYLQSTHGVSDYYFLNNMINTNRDVLGMFIQEMKSDGLRIRWADCARPASLSSQELEDLAVVGCRDLTWGLDTASQRLSNKMRKGYKIEKAVEVMRRAHEVGIHNTVNMIIGMPHETEDDFIENRRFLHENIDMLQSVAIHPYFYASKSPARENPREFSLRRKGPTFDEVDGKTWREHREKRDRWTAILREDLRRLRSREEKAQALAEFREVGIKS